jgi:hypothetical protein
MIFCYHGLLRSENVMCFSSWQRLLCTFRANQPTLFYLQQLSGLYDANQILIGYEITNEQLVYFLA